MTLARVGISLGDPGGIGPEVLCKALPQFAESNATFKIFCDRFFFERLANRCLWIRPFLDFAEISGKIEFSEDCTFEWNGLFGREDPLNGLFAFRSLEAAVDSALSGEITALVTAPLSKNAVEMATRSGFRGHTEYLRDRTGVEDIVMMLIAGDFRVVPVTRHIPISEVPSNLNERLIRRSVEIVALAMSRYEHLERPSIGVLALNPHAGDNGLFGTEEAMIARAVKSFEGANFEVVGPLVPDIAFIPRFRTKYDAIVGMFHDQVLIPLKMAGFDHGVNATLGLPFIRTSPDHGTGFDIAGENIADPSSMIEAISLAIRWADK